MSFFFNIKTFHLAKSQLAQDVDKLGDIMVQNSKSFSGIKRLILSRLPVNNTPFPITR